MRFYSLKSNYSKLPIAVFYKSAFQKCAYTNRHKSLPNFTHGEVYERRLTRAKVSKLHNARPDDTTG